MMMIIDIIKMMIKSASQSEKVLTAKKLKKTVSNDKAEKTQ